MRCLLRDAVHCRFAGKPSAQIGEAIDSAFGSFDKFKEEFSKAGATQVRTTRGKSSVRTLIIPRNRCVWWDALQALWQPAVLEQCCG